MVNHMYAREDKQKRTTRKQRFFLSKLSLHSIRCGHAVYKHGVLFARTPVCLLALKNTHRHTESESTFLMQTFKMCKCTLDVLEENVGKIVMICRNFALAICLLLDFGATVTLLRLPSKSCFILSGLKCIRDDDADNEKYRHVQMVCCRRWWWWWSNYTRNILSWRSKTTQHSTM